MRHIRALMLGLSLIALIIAFLGYLVLQEIRLPVSKDAKAAGVEIVVEKGESTSQIAAKLRGAGLIRQPLLFTALARAQELDSKLQAGHYLLTPTLTMSQIMIQLQTNPVSVEVAVTIPEGLRLEEIAVITSKAGFGTVEDFMYIARNSTSFRAKHALLANLPAGASLEGYLFPDSYRFAKNAKLQTIIETMLSRFDEQYKTFETKVQVPNVNVHQLVTMASIVQRESALISEMPLIAGVFWNRLKPENAPETGSGKLEADPTLQYALGYSEEEGTWWRKDITLEDLKSENPYNMRKWPGLPPGPICNPGLDALRSAAQPDASKNYLYFVVNCKLDGSHNFASNFKQFQSFEAEYLKCRK